MRVELPADALLRPNGTDLEEISSVTGLGRGEQIHSVRFIGDVGYVVTFRQIDPLYVLDLSDPANPVLSLTMDQARTVTAAFAIDTFTITPTAGADGSIDPAVPVYAKALAAVGVFKVTPESWSGKVKFGQNEPEKLRRVFVRKLRERGGPMDEETAREIEKTLP